MNSITNTDSDEFTQKMRIIWIPIRILQNYELFNIFCPQSQCSWTSAVHFFNVKLNFLFPAISIQSLSVKSETKPDSYSLVQAHEIREVSKANGLKGSRGAI